MVKVRKSLIGEKFGKLTVLKQAEDYIYPNGNHLSRWECLCECGNIVVVNGNSLTGGKTKSCGCLSKEDLTGQVFGRLTVVSQIEKPETRVNVCRYWLCECNCGSGKQVIVSTSDLKSGHTTSCGCLKDEKATQRIIEYNIASAGMGKKNKRTKFYQEDDLVYGFTSNTNKKFYIDLEDVEFTANYTWYESDQGYIISRINGKLVRLHRFLTNCPDEMEVDHKNHNTYDNRKENLRIVTRSQNSMNRNSKGVCYDSVRNKYIAYLKVNYEPKLFECFKSENEAIEARKSAEQKYFGEFSYTNSINGTTTGEL